MNILEAIKGWFSFNGKSKDVALVLGGGGARGIAHIGAIEVLSERGYNITSIAGTSMGALVGGLYASGKLDELKILYWVWAKSRCFLLWIYLLD